MTVNTKAYGTIDVDRRQCISIPSGLYGFEGVEEFVLIDAQQKPFFWLQSLDDCDVAFVLIDPLLVRPDYDAHLDPDDFDALKLEGPDDERLLQFAIVTIPKQHADMTVNLQGPLLINKESREARQCISPDEQWDVRHNIREEMSSSGKKSC